MRTISLKRMMRALAPLAALGGLLGAPVAAQIETIDPDTAIDGDLAQPADPYTYPTPAAGLPREEFPPDTLEEALPPADAPIEQQTASEEASEAAREAEGATYKEDDLIGAAEGLFGKGAEGVARMIQGLLAKQGEPNGYIVGREASGAFIVGARYGSGTLYHKVEGELPVYWTGPSIGFDAGANAGNTFVLVYNLYDSDELYKRFPAGEGQLYVIGGLTASYLRKGDVVLIPIRVGAGLRVGVNAGYMRFSKKQRWIPF